MHFYTIFACIVRYLAKFHHPLSIISYSAQIEESKKGIKPFYKSFCSIQIVNLKVKCSSINVRTWYYSYCCNNNNHSDWCSVLHLDLAIQTYVALLVSNSSTNTCLRTNIVTHWCISDPVGILNANSLINILVPLRAKIDF